MAGQVPGFDQVDLVAAEAKKYRSDIRLLRGSDSGEASANAKSIVSIMGLATRFGDRLRVQATGPDAFEAASTLARLLTEGSGKKPGEAPGPAAVSAEPVTMARQAPADVNELVGVSASPGVAVGKIVQYRKEVIDGCRPLISPHFNLTVELPLKAIVRGFTWKVVPITWRNRRTGEAKLKIREMGSRYLFICLYVWLEKYFSRGDYRRKK